MARLDWSTSNSQITDEIINVSSSVAFGLYHDIFYSKAAAPVVISTGAGGTGTVLTKTTDYTIGGALTDADLPTSIDPDVAYTTVAITNGTYHSTKLYTSYYPLGDFVEPADFKENQSNIVAWRSTEASDYDSAGVIVERGLRHWVSTGKSGNSNKDPMNQTNSEYWFKSPGIDRLIDMALNGSNEMCMHSTLDRAGTEYEQLLKIDEATIEGTAYEFWRIALDGSTVTGVTALVNALDVGGANQHPFIDVYAPDAAGTRTLIDTGEHANVAQSDSGESDTLGEVQADRGQGHLHDMQIAATTTGGVLYGVATFDYTAGSGIGPSGGTATTMNDNGTDGTPRTGSTTRGKQLVNGAAYIISMIPA